MTAPAPPAPRIPNPFERAASERAASTFAALLDAGLQERFDPFAHMPGDIEGERCAQVALRDASDPRARVGLVQALIRSGHQGDALFDGAPLILSALGEQSAPALTFWEALPESRRADLARAPNLLHRAAAFGLSDLCAALLDAGADPNGFDDLGRTPATRSGDEATLRLLLEGGAKLSTPLRLAGKNTSAFEYLAQTHAQSLGREGAKMLKLANEWLSTQEVEQANALLIQSAFEALGSEKKNVAREAILRLPPQIAISARNASGESLLHHAFAHQNWAEGSRLLSLGANPWEALPSGESPISLLASHASSALHREGGNWRGGVSSAASERALALGSQLFKLRPNGKLLAPNFSPSPERPHWVEALVSSGLHFETKFNHDGSHGMPDFFQTLLPKSIQAGLDPEAPEQGFNLYQRLFLRMLLSPTNAAPKVGAQGWRKLLSFCTAGSGEELDGQTQQAHPRLAITSAASADALLRLFALGNDWQSIVKHANAPILGYRGEERIERLILEPALMAAGPQALANPGTLRSWVTRSHASDMDFNCAEPTLPSFIILRQIGFMLKDAMLLAHSPFPSAPESWLTKQTPLLAQECQTLATRIERSSIEAALPISAESQAAQATIKPRI